MLVVVAHPDDETFGTGSLIAHAAERGCPVVVACATRGEAGAPVPGSVPPGTTLAAVREDELRRAADVLGAERVELVGDWTDSGMEGAAPAGSLCAAPVESVADEIARLIDEWRPTLVVTLDASDGHRDHAQVRDATLHAVEMARWQVDRVYLHCLSQALMRRWVDELERQRPDAAHLALGELGTPDSAITTLLDTDDQLPVRERAMAMHASQASPYDVMPPDLRRDFLTVERLRRVRPPWPGGAPETELFDASS